MMESRSEFSLTRAIAADNAALRFADLPADVIELAEQSVLDTLGVAIAGSLSDETTIALALASDEGGDPKASAIGQGLKLTLRQAALVNGVAAHALDYDDCNLTFQGHASATVLPAVLALGEYHRVDGRRFIEAFVAGIEAGCRVGASMAPGHYDRGFHATGTHGTIAAAAAAARLLALDPERTARTLSLAATMAAGLKAQFGTMAKPLHAGRAAENGLYAAQLATARFQANPDVIEAAQGYAATLAPTFDPRPAMDGPPDRFRIRDNLFKYHAACYGTQGVIEAASQIRAMPGFNAGTITRIEIEAAIENQHTCAIPHPATAAETRFSMAHSAALALLDIDTASPRSFNSTLVANEDIRRLRTATHIRFVEGLHIAQSRVTVHGPSRSRWSVAAHCGRPATDLPAQRRKLEAKFERLVEPLIGPERTKSLLTLIGGIQEMPDVAALVEAAACRPHTGF